MNFSNISHKDWQITFNLFPGLERHLGKCALRGELEKLQEEQARGITGAGRRVWIEDRIQELSFWAEYDALYRNHADMNAGDYCRALLDIETREKAWLDKKTSAELADALNR